MTLKSGQHRCCLCDADQTTILVSTTGGRLRLQQRLRSFPGMRLALALERLPAERHEEFCRYFPMAIVDPHWRL